MGKFSSSLCFLEFCFISKIKGVPAPSVPLKVSVFQDEYVFWNVYRGHLPPETHIIFVLTGTTCDFQYL